MKWSWSKPAEPPRDYVAEMRAGLLAELSEAARREKMWHDMYQDLLEKYTEAVRPHVPSLPVMATAVREPRAPDVISKAIREEAGTDTRLAAHLRKRAKELKTEHTDWTPQQIADELSNWQTTATDGT